MRQNGIVGSIRLFFRLALCWLVCSCGVSLAVKPAADILPNTTCMYVSFPDMDAFRASFDKTQLGQLAQDPVMKPFADDFGRQLKERFGKTNVQLGLKWSDLEGVYAGEACIARVQPNNDKNDHAVMLLLDVTGKEQQVQKVRQTVATNMKARGATPQSPLRIGGAEVTGYKLKKKRGAAKEPHVYLTVIEDQLVVTNHLELLKDVLGRIAKPANESSLAKFNMFEDVMSQVKESAGDEVPHVKWYLHPFKYAEVARASRRGRGTRGKNLAKVLVGQGFDAVRSAGGHLNMATNGYELLHRTFIYAPPVTDLPTRFKAAARSLVFPAGPHLPVPKWLPRDLATVTSVNWKVLDGFNYSTSLIDVMFEQEGLMEEVLDSFKEDVGVNLRNDLLAHLDDQIIFFTDYRLPITTSSERLLMAVRIKDKSEAEVRKAINALGEFEPQAKAVKIAGQDAWEIVSEGDAGDDEISGIELPGAGGIPLPGGDAEPAADDELSLPNSAIAISSGPDPNASSFLFIASDVGLLEEVLSARKDHATLAESDDFKFVAELLAKLGGGEDSIRVFSRSDESFRSAYEMIQLGQMPESDSLLGRLLNRLLGPDDETQVRKPEIDGSKLPDYQIVRRYLGPAGVFVQPHPNGWSVTGIMISKDQIIGDNAGAQARLTSRP